MLSSPADLSSGVHTSDILTVYISAIKALRELDPSMVILQVACQPIRKYLRSEGSFLLLPAPPASSLTLA